MRGVEPVDAVRAVEKEIVIQDADLCLCVFFLA